MDPMYEPSDEVLTNVLNTLTTSNEVKTDVEILAGVIKIVLIALVEEELKERRTRRKLEAKHKDTGIDMRIASVEYPKKR